MFQQAGESVPQDCRHVCYHRLSATVHADEWPDMVTTVEINASRRDVTTRDILLLWVVAPYSIPLAERV